MVRPALLLVAICVLTVGCSVLGPDHTREEQAEQRLAAATDALNTTDTYRFETDVTVVATTDDRTERVDVDASGGVNYATRVMWTNATFDGERAVLLVGNPTSDALTQYQERRSRSLFGGPSVENARVKVWLDPDTDRPRRTEVRFEVSGNDGSATAELTTRFTGYDDPIAVPEHTRAGDRTYELGCPG